MQKKREQTEESKESKERQKKEETDLQTASLDQGMPFLGLYFPFCVQLCSHDVGGEDMVDSSNVFFKPSHRVIAHIDLDCFFCQVSFTDGFMFYLRSSFCALLSFLSFPVLSIPFIHPFVFENIN